MGTESLPKELSQQDSGNHSLVFNRERSQDKSELTDTILFPKIDEDEMENIRERNDTVSHLSPHIRLPAMESSDLESSDPLSSFVNTNRNRQPGSSSHNRRNVHKEANFEIYSGSDNTKQSEK